MSDAAPDAMAASGLDTERLARYHRAHVHDFRCTFQVQTLIGGQSNPLYRAFAGGHCCAIRHKPDGELLPLAHAVDREYRMMAALVGSSVPVPAMRVMQRRFGDRNTVLRDGIDRGPHVLDPSQPSLSPTERHAILDDLNRVFAALQEIDYVAVGLGDFGRPASDLGCQLDH